MTNKNIYKFYPIHKNGRPVKGFCITKSNLKGYIETIYQWYQVQEQFKIYGYKLSINGEEYLTIKM